MSAASIQSFLQKEGSGLSGYTDIENCGSSSGAHYSYYRTYYSCGKREKASQIIYDASRAYGINPQAIIATMQKEESLITTPNPTSSQIKFAMGYGCPDSGGCSFPGFFNQVDNGTWQFRTDMELGSGNDWWGYSPSDYPCDGATRYYSAALKTGNNVTFKDDSGVSYNSFTIPNMSTATLYCYTPHVYNNPNGLYGLPKYGTKGDYYTGSYNFVYYFTLWFGSTYGTPFFQVTGSPNVYMQGAGETYYYIPGPGMMKAYGYKKTFNSITQVNVSYLSGQTNAGRLPQVAKFESDPIYLMDTGGAHHFATMDMYNAFGYTLGDEAQLPSWLYDKYSHPSDMQQVVTQVTSPKIYYVQSGQKSHIINPTAFDTMGSPVYSSQPSVRLTDGYVAGLPDGPPIMPTGTFVKYSDTGAYGYWNGTTLQKITSTAGAESCIPVGYTASSGDLNQLSLSASTMDSLAKSSGSTLYVISGCHKLTPSNTQLTNLGLTSTNFVTVDDNLLRDITNGTMQDPQLVHIGTSPSVYHVKSNELFLIPSKSDLYGLGYSFGDVLNVGTATGTLFTNNDKDELAVGLPIRVDGGPQVYIVDGTASRDSVPSRQVLSAFGHDINDVIDVSSAGITAYTAGTNDLGIYMKDGSGNVWLIDSGVRHQVSTTMQGASYYDVDPSGLKVITDALLGVIPQQADLTNLIEDVSTGQVYQVSNDHRNWFVNRAAFNHHGGSWSQVVKVSHDFTMSLPNGTNLY